MQKRNQRHRTAAFILDLKVTLAEVVEVIRKLISFVCSIVAKAVPFLAVIVSDHILFLFILRGRIEIHTFLQKVCSV